MVVGVVVFSLQREMDFIFTNKYLDNRDNRPWNTFVSSDKLGFFFLSPKME